VAYLKKDMNTFKISVKRFDEFASEYADRFNNDCEEKLTSHKI